MDIAIEKKNQSFRLSVDLIERLKRIAKRQNRSLNNYVETLLLDAAYHEPNATTLAAMGQSEVSIQYYYTPSPLAQSNGKIH